MLYIHSSRLIHLEWTIFKGTSNVREDFSRAIVKVFLIGPDEKYLLNATAESGKLLVDIPQELPEGAYSIEAIYAKNYGNLLPARKPLTPHTEPSCHRFPLPHVPDHHFIHPHDHRSNDRCLMRSRMNYVFAITSIPDEEEGVPSSGEITLRFKSSVASYGYDGLSAYEIAVIRGDFNGSEGDWLESMSSGNGKVKVDSELSETSKNPVENQVITKELKKKQDKLVSGKSIKTINGESILGEGNIEIKGEGTSITVEDDFGESTENPGSQRLITEVNKSLKVVSNSINNIADEEDLTLVSIINQDKEKITKIKFADKEYDAASFSGMGRVYLRKNMASGNNVLTQEMMNNPNTRYVIQYDYDLNGETITVPEGCTLDFQGGSISNGKLITQGCSINADNNTIFNNTTITRPRGYINVMWFGAKGDRVNDDTSAFQNAFSVGAPVYIPPCPAYYILKDTVKVLNNIRCKGRILFIPTVSTDIPAFYVEGGDFHSKAEDSLIIDGINMLQNGTIYTATGILVERIDTKIANSFIYTFKYGIKVRTYTVKIDACTVRSCNIDISLMAKDNYNSTNDITITNSIVSHATWLSIDIGGQKPDSVDGWNGWNILVQGCSFDESAIRIDHSYNVGIKDCYFERSTLDEAILINEDATKYPSHSVHIDNCSFLNFKYAIYSRINSNGLSVTNCTFKAIKRCCIFCLLESLGQKITIEGNIYNDSVKKFHYGIEHWSGNYNEFSFKGLSFDGWNMIDGVQLVAQHGTCNMVTKTYQAQNVIQNANFGVATVRPIMPIGNYYINPAQEVACSYIKGTNALSNTLTIPKDSDFYKFNIWDNLIIKLDDKTYNLIVIGTTDFALGNAYKVADLSYPLLESSSELTVSQKKAVLSSDWVSSELPVNVQGTSGMIINKSNSKKYFKNYGESSWKEHNEDGSLIERVEFVDRTNKSILSSKYNVTFVIIDDIILEDNEEINIQSGCILDFSRGGKLVGGTISFQSTLLLPLGLNVSTHISSIIKGNYKDGQIVYDSSLKKVKMFDGTNWINL